MKTKIGSVVRPCFNGSGVKLPSNRYQGTQPSQGVAHLVVAFYSNPSFPRTNNPETPMVGIIALPINPAMVSKIYWVNSWVLIEERATNTSSRDWLQAPALNR